MGASGNTDFSLTAETTDRPAPSSRPPKKRRSAFRIFLWLVLILAIAAVSVAVYHETKTSRFQAQALSAYASTLTYTLESGHSSTVNFPQDGPFDRRLGYVQLPGLLTRLNKRGFQVESQTHFSPALLEYTSHGLFPPYREKSQAGLHIADCRGEPLFSFRYPKRGYPDFASIPPLAAQTLLFIENRELLNPDNPYLNPAIDWGRFARAVLAQAAKAVGAEYTSMGGSTLATQIEKYRHSPDGITDSALEKLRQMASASVRAYQKGPETLKTREQMVLDYMNTVPLSAAPGYGEVHGVGDGLFVWFAADFDKVNQLLQAAPGEGVDLAEQGLALRQMLSLMIAHRRPSWYLSPGRQELANITAAYLRLMTQAGMITPALRDAALAQQISYRDPSKSPAVHPIESNKGVIVARTRLTSMLGVSLYDLDRLDLSSVSSLHRDLQDDIGAYLKRLADPAFAGEIGLLGERLLSANSTAEVFYSFNLFERTADGYRVRVQTDNTDQPFDINEGSKLELGSTAKLRVLANYLDVIAELHQQYATQPMAELRKAYAEDLDNLSNWALSYLINNSDRSLLPMLQAAMERSYSASPHEGFFTGGGMHTFGNFRSEDNGRIATVRESLRESLNLPFVRLMRDLVKYSARRIHDGNTSILKDDKDPRRQEYLERFADREGQVFLQRFWRKYRNVPAEKRLDTFLDGLRPTAVRLTAVHRYLLPDADLTSFTAFLRKQLPDAGLSDKDIASLYTRYGPGAYDLTDQSYIARVHPLELWLLKHMMQHPEASYADRVAASHDTRQQVYGWLFKTRHKNARDSRIRTMLEVEAFLDIHQRWQKFGYPFDHLVPSLATALGSSGDRPAALAELMGIILNDGVRLPAVRIEHLLFAADTPYEATVGRQALVGNRVMASEVASVLRQALSEVVSNGTARRLKGSFVMSDGIELVAGGKTGTGDNRIESVGAGGQRIRSRALNRTATFVFYLGPNHFGTLTAYVSGRASSNFSFTSALPVQVLKGMAPLLRPYLEPSRGGICMPALEPETAAP